MNNYKKNIANFWRYRGPSEFLTGFTLVELMVSITIVAVLSVIVLFSVSQFINKGKDANIRANLAILLPAGESYYNVNNSNNGTGYNGFCTQEVVKNSYSQMPKRSSYQYCSGASNPGLCCNVSGSGTNYNQWVACTQEFVNELKAFCVDSIGRKKQINASSCTSSIVECP